MRNPADIRAGDGEGDVALACSPLRAHVTRAIALLVIVCVGFPGCMFSEDGSTHAGRVLTPETAEKVGVPTIAFTRHAIDAAPRFDLRQRMIWQGSSDDSAGRVSDAVLTEDSSGVVVVLGGRSVWHWSEGAARLLFRIRSGNLRLISVSADSVLAARHNRVYVLSLSGPADSILVDGVPIGVLSSGSVVLERIDPRDRRAGSSGVTFEPSSYERRDGARTGVPAQFPLFVGGDETLARLPPLPWLYRTRATIAAGRLWVSPRSGSELIEIAPEGMATRRLRWEPRSAVSQRELDFLRKEVDRVLSEPTTLSSVYDDPAAALRRMPRERLPRALDQLIGGRDGSLWVRERRPHGTDESDMWFGIAGDGRIIGRLLLPRSAEVFEISRDGVLLSSGSNGAAAAVALYRFVQL